MNKQGKPEVIDIEVLEAKRPAQDEGVPPDLGAFARDAAHQFEQVSGNLARQADRLVHIWSDRTATYVAKQPVKSVVMAAAAGAALAMLLGRWRR